MWASIRRWLHTLIRPPLARIRSPDLRKIISIVGRILPQTIFPTILIVLREKVVLAPTFYSAASILG